MAATSFEDRLARLQPGPAGAVRTASLTPPADVNDTIPASPRQPFPYVATFIGGVLGLIVGLVIAFSMIPGSPVGPGTPYGEVVLIGAFATAVLIMITSIGSIFFIKRKPAFFYGSWAAWTGVLVAVFI